MTLLRPPCPALLAAALLWLGGGACTSGTSLDRDTDSEAASSSTSGASEGSTGTGAGEPGPAICRDECQPTLVASWTYEGESGDQEASALVGLDDGSWVVAVRRAAGGIRLVRIAADGSLQWSIVPQLPCQACRPVELAQLPSGDLLLSATGRIEPVFPASVVARIAADGHGLVWTRHYALNLGSSSTSRSGQLAVQDEDHIVMLHVEGFSDSELLVLRELDGEGNTRLRRNVVVQQGSRGDHPLLVAASTQGDVVLAYPWWNGEEDPENPRLEARTSRHVAPVYDSISSHPLALALDELVLDSLGRRIELARSPSEQTTTLLLTSRSSSDLEQWSTSLPLVTTSSTRAALAIGSGDEVYVAARTTPRTASDDFFVVELAVARYSPQGELQWQASSPLEMQATDDPLEIGIDVEDGVVVATVVSGHLRVVRYEQACTCE